MRELFDKWKATHQENGSCTVKRVFFLGGGGVGLLNVSISLMRSCPFVLLLRMCCFTLPSWLLFRKAGLQIVGLLSGIQLFNVESFKVESWKLETSNIENHETSTFYIENHKTYK